MSMPSLYLPPYFNLLCPHSLHIAISICKHPPLPELLPIAPLRSASPLQAVRPTRSAGPLSILVCLLYLFQVRSSPGLSSPFQVRLWFVLPGPHPVSCCPGSCCRRLRASPRVLFHPPPATSCFAPTWCTWLAAPHLFTLPGSAFKQLPPLPAAPRALLLVPWSQSSLRLHHPTRSAGPSPSQVRFSSTLHFSFRSAGVLSCIFLPGPPQLRAVFTFQVYTTLSVLHFTRCTCTSVSSLPNTSFFSLWTFRIAHSLFRI